MSIFAEYGRDCDLLTLACWVGFEHKLDFTNEAKKLHAQRWSKLTKKTQQVNKKTIYKFTICKIRSIVRAIYKFANTNTSHREKSL